MSSTELSIFLSLFQEVHRKCFGTALLKSLSENECKHLSNEIFEHTGLVLGWKSIKNYIQYLLDVEGQKQVNPTIASLDTLVRYIENAPKTNEILRKREEGHFPYWFGFKETFLKQIPQNNTSLPKSQFNLKRMIVFSCGILIVLSVVLFLFQPSMSDFTEDFENLSNQELNSSGWLLLNAQSDYWQKRNQSTHCLTLFTLKGDNFDNKKKINNLLIKEIDNENFSTEIHFLDFIPNHNWQQAGIILSEDSLFFKKNMRFSMNYNDFFGGTIKPAEIVLQVVASLIDDTVKPEEIAQIPIFTKDTDNDSIIANNLQKSALRIEKSGSTYRFLYAVGNANFFAFKEISSRELNIRPKYIGIYASSGDSNNSEIIPVKIDKLIFKAID